jgi:hypothetical protein
MISQSVEKCNVPVIHLHCPTGRNPGSSKSENAMISVGPTTAPAPKMLLGARKDRRGKYVLVALWLSLSASNRL